MNKLFRSKIIEEIIIRERTINGIQDIDVLLEKLLSVVRKYVNADAVFAVVYHDAYVFPGGVQQLFVSRAGLSVGAVSFCVYVI